MFARLLRLQITGLLRHLSNDCFFFVKTLLWSRLQDTTRGPTDISGNLFTISFWGIFEYRFGFLVANFPGPFGTFLFSSISLCNIFTFFILNSFTCYYIIINFMFVVPGF